MRKYKVFVILPVCIVMLSGCGKRDSGSIKAESQTQAAGSQIQEPEAVKTEPGEAGSGKPAFEESGIQESKPEEPATVEIDWSGYFDGFTGTAVLYDTGKRSTAFITLSWQMNATLPAPHLRSSPALQDWKMA